MRPNFIPVLSPELLGEKPLKYAACPVILANTCDSSTFGLLYVQFIELLSLVAIVVEFEIVAKSLFSIHSFLTLLLFKSPLYLHGNVLGLLIPEPANIFMILATCPQFMLAKRSVPLGFSG